VEGVGDGMGAGVGSGGGLHATNSEASEANANTVTEIRMDELLGEKRGPGAAASAARRDPLDVPIGHSSENVASHMPKSAVLGAGGRVGQLAKKVACVATISSARR
jgi:hypothetical protein